MVGGKGKRRSTSAPNACFAVCNFCCCILARLEVTFIIIHR